MAQNSAIAVHCWENDHSMNWKGAKIVHKTNQVSQRKVVEGALIYVCNSLKGNKEFTQEDRQTNTLICQSVNINIEQYKKSPDAVPSSSLPAQVVQVTEITDATGTDAADQRDARDPNLQENGQRPNNNNGIDVQPFPRRSRRIASRNQRTAVT